MRAGADTTLKDKDGKAITVHCHVADEGGNCYFINCFCQAVPTGEGVATQLEDLAKDHELRVLSATEVLQIRAAKSGVPAKKSEEPGKTARKVRTKALKTADEQPDPKPAEAPENAQKPGKKEDVSQQEINAEMEMLLQSFPSKMLAEELRRRGFVFCAVKPVVIEL